MKMYQFRAIASFVLAIFLTTLSVVLIVWACDQYAAEVEYYDRQIRDQKRRIRDIENKGVVTYVTTGGSQGAVIGGSAGFVGGLATGLSNAPWTGGVSVPVAVGVGVGVGVMTGWTGGSVGGAFSYYNDLSAANDELASLESSRDEYQQKYDDCVNPPARYTYTDHNGYVYEFDDYDAYMSFVGNRGH